MPPSPPPPVVPTTVEPSAMAASTLEDAFRQVEDEVSLSPSSTTERGGRWMREAVVLVVGFALGVGATVLLPESVRARWMQSFGQVASPTPSVEASATEASRTMHAPISANSATKRRASSKKSEQPKKSEAALASAPPKASPPPKPSDAAVAPEKKTKSASVPKAPTKGPGYLTVTSPRGARVYVDGVRLRRKVPFKRVRIRKGRRVIKISKRRYLRVFEVQMKPGQHLDVTGGRTRPVASRSKRP